MKKLYMKLILFLAFILQFYLPVTLNAQCLCTGGIPATPLVQTITLAPTTISTLTFNFQQFDPTVGTLNCVSFADSITGISYTGARNTGPDTTAFLFLLSLTNKVTGPGINIVHPFTQTYGYDTLAPYGIPGDTITYGPTNIITTPFDAASTGGNAAYLGTGTVPFVYAINGGMITIDGGSNYKSSVSTTIGGTLSLTYYYCPAAVLATNLLNFTAVKKGSNIMLNWDAQNADDISSYEIEYSTDGRTFNSVGTVDANHLGSASTYDYNYTLNAAASGYVYFRIKQTSISNKTGYSSVQKILLNNTSGSGVAIHPNPAVTGMVLTFDHSLTGDYSVDIVNTAGQVVFNKKIKMAGNNTIPVSWNSKATPGIYFTRVTNTVSMEQQIIRLVIQ